MWTASTAVYLSVLSVQVLMSVKKKRGAKMTDQNITKDEAMPIAPPLKVLQSVTVNKKFGWWSAVVLLESWGRKQLCFYLWQKKSDGSWRRKQKFAVHSQEHWGLMADAVEKMIDELN